VTGILARHCLAKRNAGRLTAADAHTYYRMHLTTAVDSLATEDIRRSLAAAPANGCPTLVRLASIPPFATAPPSR
jgi:hypothetical protein